MRRRRGLVEGALGRWRRPALARVLEAWREWIDDVQVQRNEVALVNTKAQLLQQVEEEQQLRTQLEARLLAQITSRFTTIVVAVQQACLRAAFSAFEASAAHAVYARSVCDEARAFLRKEGLRTAFGALAASANDSRAKRKLVCRALMKWRQPALELAMETWLQRIEDRREEKAAESRARNEEHARLVMWRGIRRMQHACLASAFDGFVQAVHHAKVANDRCQKAIRWMLHTLLHAAFSRFCEVAGQCRRSRELAVKVLGRWQSPLLPIAMESWRQGVRECQEEKEAASRQQAEKVKDHELERERARRAVVEDQMRQKVLQSLRRVILRMQHVSLSRAFQGFAESVAHWREMSEVCSRVVRRMQHGTLASAFAGFCAAVESRHGAREMATTVLKRWRAPAEVAWDRWLERMEEVKQEREKKAILMARQRLSQ
eukprot:1531581-Rhodomonas_salina.1